MHSRHQGHTHHTAFCPHHRCVMLPRCPAGKKSLAMEAFARALRQLPTTIADNAGLDSADIVATLRAAHGADPGASRMGVDVIAGAAGDMRELGIYESFKVKQQVRHDKGRGYTCL
jgi:T-complex protein 1 subunit beta